MIFRSDITLKSSLLIFGTLSMLFVFVICWIALILIVNRPRSFQFTNDKIIYENIFGYTEIIISDLLSITYKLSESGDMKQGFLTLKFRNKKIRISQLDVLFPLQNVANYLSKLYLREDRIES
jgi:hypothetical protein